MSKLHRHIGLIALTLYGVGDILGSGIYGLVGKAAGQLGNFVWLAFAVSFFVALMTGLCYAALGSRYPAAAGSSYIIWKAFRSPPLAFFAGLATLASGLTSMAAAAHIFSGYLTGMLPVIPWALAILAFCAILSGIVFVGIKESMWANAICTLVEVGGLLLVIAAGLPYLGQVNLADVSSIPEGTPLTTGLILSGAVLTFYSFVGFEDVLNVSEEVKNPRRNVPIGLLLALLIASSIYMLVSVVAVSVVPAAQLGASKQPLVDVITTAWPWFPPGVFSVIALFAVTNTALLNFIMASRLIYGLSNLGLLPKVLSRVHARTRTPYVSIAVVAMIFVALAFAGDVASLARATSIFVLTVFMFMSASVLVFQRRKDEDEDERAHAWRLPTAIPLLGVVGTAVMLAHVQLADIKIAGTLLLAMVVFYWLRRPTAHQIERFEHEFEEAGN